MSSANKGITDQQRAEEQAIKEARERFPKVVKEDFEDIVTKYKSRTQDNEDLTKIDEMGGTEQILANLEVNIEVGIQESEKEAREKAFGTNYREPAKANSWFSFLLQQLGDTMLIILICAAIVSLILSYATVPQEDYGHAWIEGGGILIAVAVVSITGSTVDYRKEIEFVKQTNDAGEKDTCLVLRDGKIKTVHHDLVVTGDIIELQVGVETPVDGIVLSCNQLQTNEAAMTGESDERKKETFKMCWDRLQDKNTLTEKNTYHPNSNDAHALPSPVILSGTSCAGGEGRYIALVVGEDSALGQILKTSHKRPQTTPLEEKLDQIAHQIGIVGVIFALLTVHGLMLIYFIDGLRYRNVDLFGGESEGEGLFFANLKIWVDYFIIGVAIIVVAVPEGLPLAVMISLAVSIKRMLEDKNYVKRLASCEIMGGADNICSDKTGTLTMNKMTVTNIYIGRNVHIDETAVGEGENKKMTDVDLAKEFGDIFCRHIIAGVSCNTPDRKSAGATDKAMFELMDRGGIDMDKEKAKHNVLTKGAYIRFPFSSKRKRMSTIIENAEEGADGYNKRILIKGASEIVKACCSHYLDQDGVRQQKDDIMDEKFNGMIHEYATKALRTIVIAYKDIEQGEGGEAHDAPEGEEIKDIEKKDLTLVAILGIKDIVRTEVPGAVETCKKAGVIVRMVTGDNITTAKAIAKDCNIITDEDEKNPLCCVEGPEFYKEMDGLAHAGDDKKERVKNLARFKDYVPHLKVMARSRPEDKYLLVTGLKNCGSTVAVTGDGTNDAMALTKADVGFGMGIAGTQTCLKAADIIILDDSFHNVVAAVSWGRNVYDNIQRFLQFQLTVNVNALFTVLISSLVTGETPLHAIQLLWVNMIMDSLAALALATERPRPELLQRPPQHREDFIVSRKMIKHIMIMAIWMCITIYGFVFFGEFIIPEPDEQWRYGKDDGYVYPGRGYDWDDEPLYSKYAKDGDSRHMTWVFNFFVFMQVWNMICARKIHDEKNIFDGLCGNLAFVLVWLFIFIGQIGISFAGRIFRLHPSGLSWEQHVTSIGFALTVFIINLISKFLPDWIIPIRLGQDRVYERKYGKKGEKGVDDEKSSGGNAINN